MKATAAGALTLTREGKAVANLKAGRYRVTVDDRSKKSGFILQQVRGRARTVTGTSFVGKQTVSVELRGGSVVLLRERSLARSAISSSPPEARK